MLNTSKIKDDLFKKYCDFQYRTYQFQFGELYRGRPFHKKSLDEIEWTLDCTRKLWCPPIDQGSKQRCSLPEDQILYLSSHISTIPFELESKQDDLFGLIEYKQIKSFEYIPIIGHDYLMKIQNQNFTSIIAKYFKDKSERIAQYDREIADLFLRERKVTNFEDSYDMSIAQTQLFLQRSTYGLIYPSVANLHKGLNLAFKQDKVKDHLIALKVRIYRLINIISHESVHLQRLSEGKINNIGDITWNRLNEPEEFIFEK